MTWKEPTPEEREAGYAASEARELHRLTTIARRAMDMLGDLQIQLGHAMNAKDVSTSAAYLRGASSTFARGVLTLIQLA